MNYYQSHKIVNAARIEGITPVLEGLKLALAGGGEFIAETAVYSRYTPVVGDYLVKYPPAGHDTEPYYSISPRDAFESGYKLLPAKVDEASIEAEITAKGLTAPRVTPQHIEDCIASEHYFTAYGGAKYGRITRDEPADSEALKLLTFCVLVLRNGFTVTGESACASPENFDAEIGRKIARQNAVAKIWALEGYLLRQRLSDYKSHVPDTIGDVDGDA